MSTFDPTKPCTVHDRLNDDLFRWQPEWGEHYRKYAFEEVWPGVIGWDGLLLDGWTPLDAR